jgi:hypothetical protein
MNKKTKDQNESTMQALGDLAKPLVLKRRNLFLQLPEIRLPVSTIGTIKAIFASFWKKSKSPVLQVSQFEDSKIYHTQSFTVFFFFFLAV